MKKYVASRRSFLKSVAGALGTGVALSACGNDSEERSSSTGPGGGEPKRGDTLQVASTASIISLDPHRVEGVAVAPYLYSYVVHDTDWQGVAGDLAVSWETPEETRWIFHLREDVVFQNTPPVNGRPLVAADVVKSIDRARSQPTASESWKVWVQRYDAPDPATFTLETAVPYAYLLSLLGSPISAVVAMEAVDEFGDLLNHTAGSGPYAVKDYSRDKGLEMVRNDTYYHDFPYLDGVGVRVLPDDASIQAAYRAGIVDLYSTANKLKAEAVQGVGGTSIYNYLDRTYACIRLNANKQLAFKDDRVREAIDISLDRRAMIEKLHFGDAQLAGPVPPAWDTALPQEEVETAYTRDVAKARQLLAAANAEDLSIPISIGSNGDMPDQAAVIKESLKESGIEVNIVATELGSWLSNMLLGNFEMTVFSHLKFMSDEIPLQSHHSLGSSRAQRDYLGVDDPEVDAILDKAQRTIDNEERKKLAWEAERLILKRHGPTLHLYQPNGYLCIHDYVKGYKPSAFGLGMFKYDYWIDKS